MNPTDRPLAFSALALGATLLSLLVLSGCQRSAGPGGPPGGMVVNVVGAHAKQQPIQETIALVGTLEANKMVEVRSEVDGTIEELLFTEGEMVSKDHILIQIDRRKLEASLAEAEAQFTMAEGNRRRYEALVASRAVSQQEFDQAVMTHAAALATVELMREQVRDATITAPFDGIIGDRLASAGQFIAKGTTLTSLVDLDPMKVAFQVPERYLSQVSQGQRITVSVAAYPQQLFTGEVYFVDSQVDEATRAAIVKAYVPNPKSQLLPGMFANLDLVLKVRADAVVIPETALLFQGETTSVFVVDGEQKAQLQPVTTGLRMPGLVEIVQGVSPGQIVVTEGTQKLHPGAAVKVRLEP